MVRGAYCETLASTPHLAGARVHAEVGARHHDAVRDAYDLVKVADRVGAVDLGDYFGAGGAVAVQHSAHLRFWAARWTSQDNIRNSAVELELHIAL